jgi:gluconokinase
VTLVLALDVGSSSVRAEAYDERGVSVDGVDAKTKYEVEHGPDGRAEFDPDGLVDACRGVYEQGLKQAGGRVDAVGTSCFMHSLTAVDANGRALAPLLTWRDSRAADHADALARRLDPEAVHARTGCPLHESFWPAKLAWLREAQPDLFRSAQRFLGFGEYLHGRLAGDARASLSLASATGLLDLSTRNWDEELLDVLGLDAGRLPELADERAGGRAQWFPAVGDGHCSNVGAGCTTRDRAALMIGTSGAYRVLFEAEDALPRPGLFLYRLDARRLLEGGSLSDGGNLHAWLERTLLPAERFGPPDGHGLTFLALLGGERSPGWKTHARGAIVGLRLETTPADIRQAALEGVAMRFAEVAERVGPVREVVASGGGLHRNPVWAQVIADVLGRPLVLSPVEEASARGAAVLALERLGVDAERPPPGETFEPHADAVAAYRAARERQRRLYDAVT